MRYTYTRFYHTHIGTLYITSRSEDVESVIFCNYQICRHIGGDHIASKTIYLNIKIIVINRGEKCVLYVPREFTRSVNIQFSVIKKCVSKQCVICTCQITMKSLFPFYS